MLVVVAGAGVWAGFRIVGSGADVGRVGVGSRVFVGRRGGTGGRVAGDGDGQLVVEAKGVNVGAVA